MSVLNKNNNSNKFLIITTLVILTIAVICQQVLFFLSRFGGLRSADNRYISDYILYILANHKIPLHPFVEFAAAQIFLYVVLVLFVYYLTKLIALLFKLDANKKYLLAIILWIITAFWIVSANSLFFPHSIFAYKTSRSLVSIIFIISSVVFAATLAAGIISLFIQLFKNIKYVYWIAIAIIATFLVWAGFWLYNISAKIYGGTVQRPNIVVIGLDSIRPDHVGYYGNKTIKTSTIDSFLNSGVNFTHAYSPLARTYVAWNNILSGKYPKHNNARDNLVNPKYLNLTHTLAARLKRAGYETIFASDNRQFNPISTKFGFDKIIGPKTGIYDFIFSLLNDFPLSNLMMNSCISRVLFPYCYGNRMTYVTYLPHTFDKLLSRQLENRATKPLFLGIHIILTHWPNEWAEDHQYRKLDWTVEYSHMIADIDKQFADILVTLKKRGILKHAVVVLLSDHGVSLGLPGDRIIDLKKYIGDKNRTKVLTRYPYDEGIRRSGIPVLGLDTSSGEGIDVLSFNSSNHIIFGIKTYGMPYGKHYDNNYRVSLIDIMPTVLDLLGLPKANDADGVSLLPFMINKKPKPLPIRPMYFETGIWLPMFSVEALKSGNTQKFLVDKLKKLYAYDSISGSIFLKYATLNELLRSKQRGMLYGDWYLARYPKGLNIESVVLDKNNNVSIHCDFSTELDSDNTDKIVCYNFITARNNYYVLVNVKTGKWTMDLDSDFAKNSPFKLMMQKFKDFYGMEVSDGKS